MDAITCLSIAGTAIQFLEFSLEIVSKGLDLYQNGQLSVHIEAEDAVEDLLSLTSNFSCKLERPLYIVLKPATQNELALQKLCEDCGFLAKELKTKFSLLHSQKGKVWGSFRSALLSVWKEKELSKFEKRLSEYRAQIDSRMINCILDQHGSFSLLVSQRFDELDLQTKRIASALHDFRQSVSEHSSIRIENRIETFGLLLDRLEMTSHTIEEPRVKGITAKLSTSSELKRTATLDNSTIESIIKSLWYPAVQTRIDNLKEAHDNTFDWIFRSASSGIPWSDFVDWLEKGKGIYWIYGKAGSGKSVLMKYICEDKRTNDHLLVWAQESELLISNHFFWNGGDPLQKNQIGLIRSILYNALKKFPLLVPTVLSSDWTTVTARSNDAGDFGVLEGKSDKIWTLPVLLRALKLLISQKGIDIKICLFIDGLDEYGGDYEDLVKLFRETAISTNVKICVSSRPEVAFITAYNSTEVPSLALHDLTKNDIRQYVDDKLINNSRLQQLSTTEPVQTGELVSKIVDTANGVFLWVQLAVDSLLRGLLNHDRITDLETRLRMLPPDLETFFDMMVLRVEDIYTNRASRIYQLVEAGYSGAPEEPLTVLELYFAQEDQSNDLSIANDRLFTEEEVISKCKDMETWLQSCCGGLLEIYRNTMFQGSILPSMPVGYLHRTARDYLSKKRTQLVLQERTSSTFNPSISILRAIVFRIKLPQHIFGMNRPKRAEVSRALTFAHHAEKSIGIGQVELLDELEQTLNLSVLREAIRMRLQLYVTAKITTSKTKSNEMIQSRDQEVLLFQSFRFYRYWFVSEVNVPDPEQTSDFLGMVSALLQLKADPNQISYDGRSPWQRFLDMLSSLYDDDDAQSMKDEHPDGEFKVLWRHWSKQVWAPCMIIFLQYGADVNAPCRFPKRYHGKTWAALLANYEICTAADLIKEIIDLEQEVELGRQLKKSKMAQGWLRILPPSTRMKWSSRSRRIG